MRVGVEDSLEDSLLKGFDGLELVRLPAEPQDDIAVDFWIPSLSPAISRRQWPRLKGVQVVQGLWAGVDALRPMISGHVTLCSARGVHDAPTAEWAVTATLAMQKYLPFYVDLQHRGILSFSSRL
jgi:phosphoglycerate dehydrogenase-like enzyme